MLYDEYLFEAGYLIEAGKDSYQFDSSEANDRLKRRIEQNKQRLEAARERSDVFAMQLYKLKIELDEIDKERFKVLTDIANLKAKYKK